MTSDETGSAAQTQITARRATFNVFAISGTFFALLSVGMYVLKGGSLPFAIGLGYAFGAVMAAFYYGRHHNKFRQGRALYDE